jgi:hypothetical protein
VCVNQAEREFAARHKIGNQRCPFRKLGCWSAKAFINLPAFSLPQ